MISPRSAAGVLKGMLFLEGRGRIAAGTTQPACAAGGPVTRCLSTCLFVNREVPVCKQARCLFTNRQGRSRPLFRVDKQNICKRTTLCLQTGSPDRLQTDRAPHALTRPSPLICKQNTCLFANGHFAVCEHREHVSSGEQHNRRPVKCGTPRMPLACHGSWDSSAPPPAVKIVCLQTDILRCPCANRHVDKPLKARSEGCVPVCKQALLCLQTGTLTNSA